MQAVNKNLCEIPNDNIAMPNNPGLICPVVDANSGNICGEKSGLQILDEFRKLYEQRIQSIDPNSDNEVEERMNIMMEWIKDLDAQNRMLVSTVEELEAAACCRVKMLEEKLKNTSSALTDGIAQYTKPPEKMLDSLHERIDKLEINGEKSQKLIKNLQSDIRGLLELIRRAVTENRWRLDGIKFFEIDRGSIPIPDEHIYDQAMGDNKNVELMTQQLQFLSENEKKSIEYQNELQHKVRCLSEELQDREDKLQKLKSKFEDLNDSFKRRAEANADLRNETSEIIHLLNMEESDFVTVENSDEDLQEKFNSLDGIKVRQLQNELEEKTREITRLTRQFKELEKESSESREALVQEVAEKHDTAMKFKKRVDELEDYGRRLSIQLKYKEDLNEQLRKDAKLLKIKAGSMSSRSPTKVNSDASPTLQRKTWNENISGEASGQIKVPNGSLLSTYPDLKTTFMNEQHLLKELIHELNDVWYRTVLMEKANYDKYLAVGQSKLDEITVMLEKYRSQVNENSDQESTKNGALFCTLKLMKVIDSLTELCTSKSRIMSGLELALQDMRMKHDEICSSSKTGKIVQQNPDVSPHQFNAMREFRTCAVEAQAAVEDLREEIEIVMCNLNCRHQLFVDLCKSIEPVQDVIARTKQNISSVINNMKAHVEEKIIGNDTIKISQGILKEMKNDINEARSKFSLPSNYSEHEFDIKGSYDKIVHEVDTIMSSLKGFIAKDDYSLTLLEEFHDHVNNMEKSLDKMQANADRVIQENKISQKIVDDKATRLDKLEQELDYAQSKIQDTLETILADSQQNESSNGHPGTADDTLTLNESEGDLLGAIIEIDELKTTLNSKDKLLEHKDEIIRIQKDSLEMTQGEYENLRQRLQSKIETQVVIINQYLEEKIRLVEQNRLQTQTIKHLQDAVVEAKKNLNRQLPQKSAVDLGGGDNRSPISPPVFNNGNVHDV